MVFGIPWFWSILHHFLWVTLLFPNTPGLLDWMNANANANAKEFNSLLPFQRNPAHLAGWWFFEACREVNPVLLLFPNILIRTGSFKWLMYAALLKLLSVSIWYDIISASHADRVQSQGSWVRLQMQPFSFLITLSIWMSATLWNLKIAICRLMSVNVKMTCGWRKKKRGNETRGSNGHSFLGGHNLNQHLRYLWPSEVTGPTDQQTVSGYLLNKFVCF